MYLFLLLCSKGHLYELLSPSSSSKSWHRSWPGSGWSRSNSGPPPRPGWTPTYRRWTGEGSIICLFFSSFCNWGKEEEKFGTSHCSSSPEEGVATKEQATILRGSHTKVHPPPHPEQMQGQKAKSNDGKAYLPPPPVAWVGWTLDRGTPLHSQPK